MLQVWGRGKAYAVFWWRNLREKGYLGDLGVDRRIILRWISRRSGIMVWDRSSWLMVGTGGGHL
jgi:hypothetical protein